MAEPATQCRGNMVGGEGGGGGGGMRTVECLRGRLLAERVASKAAKEEADQLAARLEELEKKLSDEVKIRNKAERRLRRAIKRLESLKILDVELSESSLGSLSSNGGCSSGQRAPEMEERNDPGSLSTVDSGLCGGEEKGWDGSSAGSCTQVNSSQDGSWFSVVSEQSGSGLSKGETRVDPDDAKNCGSGDSADGVDDGSERGEQEQPAASSGPSKSEDGSYRDEADDRLALVLVGDAHHEGGSRMEGNTDHSKDGEEEENNKLAIVLADPQPRRDAESGSGGNDVQSVLLALQRVKEQLLYTIERRSEGLVAHRVLYGH